MGRFVREALEVEAYQFNGNNLASITKSFQDGGFELRSRPSQVLDSGFEVWVEDLYEWKGLNPGNYIVREDGELRVLVLNGWMFQKDFRPYVEEENGIQDQLDAEAEADLRTDLTKLLNRYNAEKESGTPDFVLADVAMSAIEAFNNSVIARAGFRRERWVYEPPTDGKHVD